MKRLILSYSVIFLLLISAVFSLALVTALQRPLHQVLSHKAWSRSMITMICLSPQPITGAIVFNENGEVTGIGGITPGFSHFPLGYAVNINSAKDSISGSTEQQPWYKGPILLYTRYSSDQGGSIQYDSEVPKNYQDVTLSIENVINNVVIPVTGNESVKVLGDITEDSTIIIAVFARPVQLHYGEEVVGTAKWIGIQ